MTILSNETKWVIMSKDRTWIAKGVPRNRYLIPVDDAKDKKRLLTYNSKALAESAFRTGGFYTSFHLHLDLDLFTPKEREDFLEAAEVNITVEIVE